MLGSSAKASPPSPGPPSPQVLASEVTLGYEDIYNVQLLRFNGSPVCNLKHLAQLVAACQDR